MRDQNRDFITGVLRDLEGFVPMGIATGRSKSGKLEIKKTDWFHYPSQLDKMLDYAEMNRSGDRRNVYLGPSTYGNMKNAEGSRERSIKNALMCQTIYMDSDSCPPDAFRLQPSRHVNTSPGHGHDYWFLIEPIPTSEAAEIAHRITTAHREQGSDPTGWSANKFLRMPTVNTSYNEAEPYKINYRDTGEVYEAGEISEAYSDITVVEAVATLGTPTDDEEIPQPEDLPSALDLIDSIPVFERRLNELIHKVPARGEKGWQSQQRWALLCDLFRYGFKIEEVVSIAWSCPAAQKWREDQRGIGGLWMEARKASLQVESEKEQPDEDLVVPDAEPTDYESPEVLSQHEPIKLLTPEQRAKIAHVWGQHEQYMDWARTRVPVFNDPLHSIGSWTILSLAYSEHGYIPKESGPMHPNIYSNTISVSSSGKSEAKRIQESVQLAVFGHDSPDMGIDFSKTSLVENLIERDGKVTWFHADEAHGIYRIWKGNGGTGWTVGIQETFTLVYDGPIPSLGRSGRKIQRGMLAIPVMQMTGTPEGMFDVLDRGMFLDGFLARNIWVIGQQIPMTEESVTEVRQVTSANTKMFYRAMPNYIASQVQANITRITAEIPLGENATPMLLTEEAKGLFGAAKWKMVKFFDSLADPALFTTARNRMWDIIWKAACLIAMSEGERYINSVHMTQALAQAEVWIESLVYVADRIQNSTFSKKCDEISEFVKGRPGNEAEVSSIYQRFRSEDVHQVDRYLESLVKQRRLIETKNSTKKTVTYGIPKKKESTE